MLAIRNPRLLLWSMLEIRMMIMPDIHDETTNNNIVYIIKESSTETLFHTFKIYLQLSFMRVY